MESSNSLELKTEPLEITDNIQKQFTMSEQQRELLRDLSLEQQERTGLW